MEEVVSDLKHYRSEKGYRETEAECLDDTSPGDMEECVRGINDDKNENYYK